MLDEAIEYLKQLQLQVQVSEVHYAIFCSLIVKCRVLIMFCSIESSDVR